MQETLTERVAATVRAEMARRRVTQGRLAQELGFTQQAISRRLGGEVPFNVNELDQIAGILGVPLSTLLNDQKASA